jgi:valine--pyruvate aminotransferase
VGLSFFGTKMASVSGLRSIMEDIATTTATSGGTWLNLSIGNPAPIPEAISMWRQLTEETLTDSFASASCRYGASRGAPPLVEAVADYFRSRYGWPVTPENVVVGPGSQMLAFMAAALFTGSGEGGLKRLLLPMVPEYTGYQGLSLSDETISGVAPLVDLGDDRRFRYSYDVKALRRTTDVGMILLSSPSNPTGRAVDADELDLLVGLTERLDVPLLVDNAYGSPFPQIVQTHAPPPWHEKVINLFTASKAGLPGDRVGFAIGPKRHISAMVSFVANAVLHAPQLPQMVVARALSTGALDHLVTSAIRPYYLTKRALAEKMLAEALPESVEWRLHSSEGGMFCWLWVDDEWFDDVDLYRRMKRKNVFVVPGRHFFAGPAAPALGAHPTQCFRISLSTDESVIVEGVGRIAEALKEMRRAH